MKKLLTTITLLCFSVAANAEIYACAETNNFPDGTSALVMRTYKRVGNNFEVEIRLPNRNNPVSFQYSIEVETAGSIGLLYIGLTGGGTYSQFEVVIIDKITSVSVRSITDLDQTRGSFESVCSVINDCTSSNHFGLTTS